MELHQLFFGLILSIGAIHLAAVAGRYLSSLGGTSDDTAKLREDGRERDDWYVFFHCADLLGKESTTMPPAPNRKQITGNPAHQRHNSQPSRRRLRA